MKKHNMINYFSKQAKKYFKNIEFFKSCHVTLNLRDKNHTTHDHCSYYLCIENNKCCSVYVSENRTCHMIIKIEVSHERFNNLIRLGSMINFMNITSNFK